MNEIDVTHWKKLIETSGGLADSVNEIDIFLGKLGTVDLETKIKLMVSNIASYFKQHKIIINDISTESVDECYKLIKHKIEAKEISGPTEFIIAVLIALLAGEDNSNETNYLTTENTKTVDDKIKDIASGFLLQNKKTQSNLVDEFKALALTGDKKVKEELVAFRKNLANSNKLGYV